MAPATPLMTPRPPGLERNSDSTQLADQQNRRCSGRNAAGREQWSPDGVDDGGGGFGAHRRSSAVHQERASDQSDEERRAHRTRPGRYP